AIPLFRCPSSPSPMDATAPPYNTTYISPGNDAFAPPSIAGSGTNIFGKKVYPTTPSTSTGWVADYAPLCQVTTTKNGSGFAIAPANPLLATVYVNGAPTAGAMRQNGPTRILEITDGTTTTTLYSEACGRDKQYYADRIGVAYDPTQITGPIWA